ncbi:MAG: fibronectin type III domain-containing protein, partial [DPANN group archaeon]|nr:fibronectin type III domain-containing protein [DPANN group archaeon]
MVNKKNIYFIGILFSIICIYLILAAPNAPTNLVFNNNATPNYDEGTFTLNWTSGAGDAESNYSIYVFSNGSNYLIASNNSVTGYSFSNTTEANYTFIVQAVNETGFGANSSNISIYVDTTAP